MSARHATTTLTATVVAAATYFAFTTRQHVAGDDGGAIAFTTGQHAAGDGAADIALCSVVVITFLGHEPFLFATVAAIDFA